MSHASSLMGKPFSAAGMTAIARKFDCFTCIITILATIFTLARRDAVTSRMSALLSFRHNFGQGPPFPPIGRLPTQIVSCDVTEFVWTPVLGANMLDGLAIQVAAQEL